MRKFVAQSISIVLLVAPVSAYAAGRTEQTKHYSVDGDGVALGGYDPVSYFGTPHPTKGDKSITAEVGGVVYRFASDANRQAFLADPGRYRPAYGGWCATAMAAGKKVEVDPRNYRVTDGRLFLFYKSVIHDAQDDWKKDETGLRAKADDNWVRVSGEKPGRQ
jgi:hypothetical protein